MFGSPGWFLSPFPGFLRYCGPGRSHLRPNQGGSLLCGGLPRTGSQTLYSWGIIRSSAVVRADKACQTQTIDPGTACQPLACDLPQTPGCSCHSMPATPFLPAQLILRALACSPAARSHTILSLFPQGPWLLLVQPHHWVCGWVNNIPW